MTERDLVLKASVRRLLWRIGFSTKVDVPLRAYVREGTRNRPGIEAYTDLDVLGVMIGPDANVHAAIADCKTSLRGSTERMFWTRGVADFFGANDGYLVRSHDVTAASRQLASRLGIAVLTPPDLAALEASYPTAAPVDEPALAFLFSPSAIGRYRSAIRRVDKGLLPLVDFCESDYWVYDQHRNLLQVVAHLRDAAGNLHPNNAVHRAIFFECAWLYSLSVAHAVQYVRRTQVTNVDTAMREYLFGGQLGLREKRELAAVLRRATGREQASADEGLLPTYFSPLLEVVTRFLRRPQHLTDVLRYSEWASEASIAERAEAVRDVFPAFDGLAGKLLADVCSFLVSAAVLDTQFRAISRDLLSPTPPMRPEPAQATAPPTTERVSPTEASDHSSSEASGATFHVPSAPPSIAANPRPNTGSTSRHAGDAVGNSSSSQGKAVEAPSHERDLPVQEELPGSENDGI